LRINAIVDDHIAVAVALVFAKLSIGMERGAVFDKYQILKIFLQPPLYFQDAPTFT
jgi:hypothetical protein